VAAFCEHGNESFGSIKGEEFLDLLSDYSFLKKDSIFTLLTPWSKVVPVLFLTEHYAMEAYWGVEV
jgi:hypothetical protein